MSFNIFSKNTTSETFIEQGMVNREAIVLYSFQPHNNVYRRLQMKLMLGDGKKILQSDKENFFDGASRDIRTEVRFQGTDPKMIAIDAM